LLPIFLIQIGARHWFRELGARFPFWERERASSIRAIIDG
jgi:hypothetical protein